jgi:hypothetical protein
MASQDKNQTGTDKKPPKYTEHDDAEYHRLAAEMNEDARLQFTLFTFGITASTAVLGFLTSADISSISPLLSGLPPGSFFLTPLIVLIPTSLTILNRARTRNRKASYIMVNFDRKRLYAEEEINDKTSLEKVRKHPFLPWETALHILQRTNPKDSPHRRVHLAPSLKYMAICYCILEMLCVFLTFYASRKADLLVNGIMGGILAILLIFAYWSRGSTLIDLRKTISIQGYVKQWLNLKYGTDEETGPKYLFEWVREFESQTSKVNQS